MQNSYSGNRGAAVEESMRKYAYVLLATTENLGSVTFEYEIDGTLCDLTVDVQEASAYAGADIKQVGRDVNQLEHLIQKTELNGNAKDGYRVEQ